MSEDPNIHRQPESADESDRPPWQQILFDDIFLLMMAGLVIPTLVYIVWSLNDLARVPIFQP